MTLCTFLKDFVVVSFILRQAGSYIKKPVPTWESDLGYAKGESTFVNKSADNDFNYSIFKWFFTLQTR